MPACSHDVVRGREVGYNRRQALLPVTPKTMRLLLIEDDEILGEGLRDYLVADGQRVDWCRRLCEAASYRGEPYDALLVDWHLPDGSGLDWLKRQRAAGERRPALMLTARDLLSDRIRGLDSGADDYLVKPFAPEELAARLRAVVRRSSGTDIPWRCIADVEIDLSSKIACRSGQRVELTAREWAILEALLLRAGRTVAKADLERLVLGFDAEWASNAIEVHIASLRRKLGRELVVTVRGLGYRAGSAA